MLCWRCWFSIYSLYYLVYTWVYSYKYGGPLLAVFPRCYGVDGCLTILHRIMLHENISQPHRKHLFQIMANELKIPHVIVSLVYMAVQLLCCIWYIMYPGYLTLLFQIIILSIIYILFMRKFFKLHQR